DAARRRAHQAPSRFTGHGIAVDLPEVALCRQVTLVFEQVFELLGIAFYGAGRAVIVETDRLPELVADPEQLLFLLPLALVGPDNAGGGEHGAADGDEEENREVGEALLASAR